MLSSGRPCLRRRLSVVLDTAAAGSDEPLLFLYPRWAAPALQRHQIASLTTKAASANRPRSSKRSLPSEISSHCPSPISLRRQPSQWFSSDAGARASDDDGSTTEIPLAGNERIRSNGKSFGNEGSVLSNIDQTTSVIEPKRPLSSADIEVTTPARGPITWRNRRRTQHNSSLQPMTRSTRGLPPRTADLTPRLSVRDRKKLRYGTFVKERSKDSEKLSYYPVGGWDSMKDILERQEMDPRVAIRRSSKQKEIQVPEETIALMAGVTDKGVAENIYYIPIRNGCRVQILHPRDGDGVLRKVILSGSERVMELVEDLFKRAQAQQDIGDPLVQVSKPPFPIFSSIDTMRRNKIPVPMIRGVWVGSTSDQMSYQELINSDSSLGSVKEFAERIEDLINTWKPGSSETSNNDNQRSHRDHIVRRILKLFQHDSNRKFFSSAALNQALVFLCDQELLSTARAVFLRSEHVATADTYNIFLRSAARRQDLKTFRRFLVSMNRANIRPNPETWLVLLEAMVTPNAKASLIAHLVQKGYMARTGITRTALQLTIQDSLLVHLENGQSMESFIALMVKTNEANWFNPSILSQMFNVIARRKDFTALNVLLRFCFDNQLVLESSTLTSIMSMCRKDASSIVDYMLPLLRQPNFRLSREALDFFFRVAYKGQKYNICRVLWRYACLYGLLTHRMKEVVLSSLQRNISLRRYANEHSHYWQLYAGKIIVGLELHLPREKDAKSIYPTDITNLLPSEFRDNPLDFLSSGFKPKGEERELQHRVAWMLIKRDIRSGAFRYLPEYPLSVMLESAAILDAEWKRHPRTLNWLLKNAIQVPIKRRSSGIMPSSQSLSSARDVASLDLYSATSALHA